MNVWVLLRGLTRDNRHWGNFPELFSAAKPGIRVVALDLPGNGARHLEKSPISVGAMVEDCRRSLREQGINAPVNLLAMSLGAMVAIDWASRYPEEIDRGVLINTSLSGVCPFFLRLRPRNYWRLLRMVLSQSDTYWEQSVLAMTSRRDDPQLVRRWAEFRRLHPVGKANALRQLLAAARFRAPTECPTTALLLLASTHDRLVNVACSRAIAGRWRIPLIEHPSAGHDLPLDEGPWVIEQVRRWLALEPAGKQGNP
jgi:pimeloyl-ACP methyl ester carboxylesterase